MSDRLVSIAVLVLLIQTLTPDFTARASSTVLMDGVTALAFAAHIMRFRLRLLVDPHQTALDAHGAVMIENDKGSTTRDVGESVGLTLEPPAKLEEHPVRSTVLPI